MAKTRKDHFDKSKPWKYWRTCRLPSCRREFGTNRDWQHFCPGSDHQRQWHRLLKRRQDHVVELRQLREEVKSLRKELGSALEEFRRYRTWLHEQFQIGGTPKELRDMIRQLEKKRPG